MTVVSAEYSYDGSRLVVSFTAEGRIDFRDLVRDLARSLNTRIEMKQIGVRDQAKVLDGVGKCGRQLCCSAWLREFNPVTIKMAKQQNLPLNPPEISGVCGRLLCCLAYEADVYEDARKQLPKVGAAVMTPEGEGPCAPRSAATRDGHRAFGGRGNQGVSRVGVGRKERPARPARAAAVLCGASRCRSAEAADEPDGSADMLAGRGTLPGRQCCQQALALEERSQQACRPDVHGSDGLNGHN